MCGRFIAKTDQSWQNFFTLRKPPPEFEAYNISPTQNVPVVRRKAEGNECDLLRWGLVPFFAKGVPGAYATFNARMEGIVDGPEKKSASYRGPWKRGQRCILPANGFYEWHVNEDGTKQPFFITCADQPVFGFAGLWESSSHENGTVLESATIITMPPNPLMAEIHNVKQRMPAILAMGDHEAWLAGTVADATVALKQYPADLMAAWPVGARVNSSRNQGSKLIAPV